MAELAHSIPVPTGQSLVLADLSTSNDEARVLDIRAAEVLGYERPADIRPLIERHIEALERLGAIIRTVRKNGKRGRPSVEVWLNKRQLLFICTKAQTERATDATIQMVGVFDEWLRGTLVSPKRTALPRPRKPKRTVSAAPVPHLTIDRENMAIMRVGAETLLVDLTRIEFGPEERVVCFDADGVLTVQPVRMSWPHQNWNGRRFGYLCADQSKDGGSAHRGVWTIGGVIATLPDPVGKEGAKPKQIAHTPRRHPRRFETGSDLKRDLLLLVRSARDRLAKGKALDLGQALAETLEDVIATDEDPLAPRRGVTLDWDEERATEDLHRKMRAEGKDPSGLKAREVLH